MRWRRSCDVQTDGTELVIPNISRGIKEKTIQILKYSLTRISAVLSVCLSSKAPIAEGHHDTMHPSWREAHAVSADPGRARLGRTGGGTTGSVRHRPGAQPGVVAARSALRALVGDHLPEG